MSGTQPDSKFVKVKCEECGNEQDIFNKPAEPVKCTVCDDVLAENTGGKAKIKTEVLKEH